MRIKSSNGIENAKKSNRLSNENFFFNFPWITITLLYYSADFAYHLLPKNLIKLGNVGNRKYYAFIERIFLLYNSSQASWTVQKDV